MRVRWGMARVHGRSMTPTLRDGDRVLVRHGAVPRSGQVAVVRFADGVVAVKRLERLEPEGWWVSRDNLGVGRDSWSAGAIAPDDVVAVVAGRIWPHPGRLPGAPPARGVRPPD